MGVPKFSQLEFLRLWGPITLRVDLQSRWGLKKICSSRWYLPNGMSHATYTEGNWGDSWLLVVMSQIVNLTPDPSFGHNLCLKCSNGSCKLILDIYIPRAFQWYNKLLNPMGFDPCNFSLKIQKSIGTPIPKAGAPLGVCGFIPSHSFTLSRAWNVTLGIPFWLTPLEALGLVASPRLRLWQWFWVRLHICHIKPKKC